MVPPEEPGYENILVPVIYCWRSGALGMFPLEKQDVKTFQFLFPCRSSGALAMFPSEKKKTGFRLSSCSTPKNCNSRKSTAGND